MRLSEFRQDRPGRSCVDLLPDEVRDQLVEAKRARTHSVPMMVEWLRSEGYDSVSADALNCWFTRHGIRGNSG